MWPSSTFSGKYFSNFYCSFEAKLTHCSKHIVLILLITLECVTRSLVLRIGLEYMVDGQSKKNMSALTSFSKDKPWMKSEISFLSVYGWPQKYLNPFLGYKGWYLIQFRSRGIMLSGIVFIQFFFVKTLKSLFYFQIKCNGQPWDCKQSTCADWLDDALWNTSLQLDEEEELRTCF